jgi:hypothetical protein
MNTPAKLVSPLHVGAIMYLRPHELGIVFDH